MKPIVVFDIEATGVNVATDRIVSFAAVKLPEATSGFMPDWDDFPTLSFLCNPGVRMAPEVIAVHGITNEMVAGLADFSEMVKAVHDFISGCDLGGFNHSNFDVPMLANEFERCGIRWDPITEGHRLIDAGTLFKKREPRDLSAASRFYLGQEHGAAHDAMGDVVATANVLAAQIHRYKLEDKTRGELETESSYEQRLDLDGKIVRNKDGVWSWSFGKNKGQPVTSDRGFAAWVMRSDFSRSTKDAVVRIFGGKP